MLAHPELGRQLAENGRREVLARHTIQHRVAELLPWLEQHVPAKAVPASAPTRPASVKLGANGSKVPPEAAAAASTMPAPLRRPAPVGPRGSKVIINGVIFELQQKNPAGISRVWTALLGELAKSDLAKDIILLDRANTAPIIPGLRTRPAPPLMIGSGSSTIHS